MNNNAKQKITPRTVSDILQLALTLAGVLLHVRLHTFASYIWCIWPPDSILTTSVHPLSGSGSARAFPFFLLMTQALTRVKVSVWVVW